MDIYSSVHDVENLYMKEEQLQTSEALVAEVLKHSEKQKDSKFPSLKVSTVFPP